MKKNYVLIVFLAVFSIAFCLFGCDCGDGDAEDGSGAAVNDGDDTLADVDLATAETAIAMLLEQGISADPVNLTYASVDDVFDIIRMIVDHVEQIIDGFFSTKSKNTSMFLRSWAIKKVEDALLSGTIMNQKSELPAGSVSEIGSCTSGSYQATGSWTGPDKPTLLQLCDVSDIEMTMTFDSCQELGITAGGEAKISLSGNLCSPESVTVELNNFNIKDSNSGTEIVFNTFNMAATVELLENLKVDAVHIVSVMNGDMAINNVSTEYKDFVEDSTFTKEGVTVSANGSMTGSCIDGWLNIETLSPVTINYGDCPSSGDIKISGNGDMSVTFNSDGSVTIGETSFDSCTDVLAIYQ